MTDPNLWKNDINNRFAVTSLTDVIDGAGFVATSVISGVTTNSSWKMSLSDAYKDLREKLLDGDDTLLPHSTTTQADALVGIVGGTQILNTTESRQEVNISNVFESAAGSATMGAVAYGSMFENEPTSSTIDPTTQLWISASQGLSDGNGIITFVSSTVDGDHLLVGTGGAGDYMITASCSQTNSGNNVTTMEIRINGGGTTNIKVEGSSNSTKPITLAAHGMHGLSEGDKVSLHLESSISTDSISLFDGSVTIQRLD